jgi:hypothetical protein
MQADERWLSEKDQKDKFYVHDIFMELNSIYLKKKQKSYKYDVYGNILLHAVTKCSQDVLKYCHQDNYKGETNIFIRIIILWSPFS